MTDDELRAIRTQMMTFPGELSQDETGGAYFRLSIADMNQVNRTIGTLYAEVERLRTLPRVEATPASDLPQTGPSPRVLLGNDIRQRLRVIAEMMPDCEELLVLVKSKYKEGRRHSLWYTGPAGVKVRQGFDETWSWVKIGRRMFEERVNDMRTYSELVYRSDVVTTVYDIQAVAPDEPKSYILVPVSFPIESEAPIK